MVQEEKSVNITYETLFELLRLEKAKEELQRLDATFYQDVVNYLKEKHEILKEIKSSEMFSDVDRESTEKQIMNIKRLLRDLYDRREKKIINMALNKTRANAHIADMQNMLAEERKFFESLVALLEKYRKDILYKILELKLPSADSITYSYREEPKERSDFVSATELKDNGKKDKAMVRLIHPVPRVVGPELEEYGPFENEDIALLPTEVANVLVFKKRAEIIDEK